jgi:radical SAM superfamily enzyme YgiQ (UPF0313 family)
VRKAGNIFLTSARPQVKNLDQLPFPHRSLVDMETYNRYIGDSMVKNRISLMATRGCPYHCLYCHKIWPSSHVCRSAENIYEELSIYYDMGVRQFSFIDDIFNFDAENSSRFFRMVIKNNLDVQLFFPNGMRGDILTRDYIDLVVEAGTVELMLGLETASPRLQKLLGRNLDIEKLRENIHYIIGKYPALILGLFTMHGFPTETKEEAMMTLDFIRSFKWLHFPLVNVLKIYPNTPMAKLAEQKGISFKSIEHSSGLGFHDLPDTLPFEKHFSFEYKAQFLHGYFLNKERLLHVLPYQIKVLTEDEFIQKYNSYLPFNFESFDHFLHHVGISRQELEPVGFVEEDAVIVPHLNRKLRSRFSRHQAATSSLRLLLLDLSQFFSHRKDVVYDIVEPPLGLICLLTYLNRQLGETIQGKIAKSRFDFDNYAELRQLLKEFQPAVIGIRTLTFFKDFFHETVAALRRWGFTGPIITGGPYATSDYPTILHDSNVDLVVLGEGEITFLELIEKMIENNGKLPSQDILKEIKGLAWASHINQIPNPANDNTLLKHQAKSINQGKPSEPLTAKQQEKLAHLIDDLGDE